MNFSCMPMLSACPSHLILLDLLRPSLFRDVTQPMLVVVFRRFGQPIGPVSKGQAD